MNNRMKSNYIEYIKPSKDIMCHSCFKQVDKSESVPIMNGVYGIIYLCSECNNANIYYTKDNKISQDHVNITNSLSNNKYIYDNDSYDGDIENGDMDSSPSAQTLYNIYDIDIDLERLHLKEMDIYKDLYKFSFNKLSNFLSYPEKKQTIYINKECKCLDCECNECHDVGCDCCKCDCSECNCSDCECNSFPYNLLESNNTESNNTESNNTESDDTESDDIKSDDTESDNIKSDDTKSDDRESDVDCQIEGSESELEPLLGNFFMREESVETEDHFEKIENGEMDLKMNIDNTSEENRGYIVQKCVIL